MSAMASATEHLTFKIDAKCQSRRSAFDAMKEAANCGGLSKTRGMTARRWLVLCLIVLLPPSLIASCAIHDNRLESNFEQVTPGMQRQEVEAILGKPSSIEDCAHTAFKPWQRPDCRDVCLYPTWAAPLLPSMWVVWLNADGTVIDKYHFVSW